MEMNDFFMAGAIYPYFPGNQFGLSGTGLRFRSIRVHFYFSDNL